MSEVLDQRAPQGFLRTCWTLISGTTAICFRYRVTGLASEAAFFALVSLPPLVMGVVGTIGLVANRLPPDTLDQLRERGIDAASQVLQPDVVQSLVVPLIDSVIDGAGFPITVIGLAIMLWSGSRWLNVYVDTITIMYGLNGHRHFLKTRALSFSLYLLVMLVGVILLPLLAVGPDLLGRLAPSWSGAINAAYFPVVGGISILFLTSLYHVSVPVRTPWRRDLPGAGLALAIWLLGSFVLRFYLGATVSSSSAYGSLAAAIAVLFWLYVTALAVLIGAGLNAVVDRTWPISDTEDARDERTAEAAQEAAEDADTELALAAARKGSRARNRPAGPTDSEPDGEAPQTREPDAATPTEPASTVTQPQPAPPNTAGEAVQPAENPVREGAVRS
jgi:membrane protein